MKRQKMSESKIFQRATNPEQYDSEDLTWGETEGGIDSPRTSLFREYLIDFYPHWKDKDFLDIGAGNGWLLKDALGAGARTAVGIEPSARNSSFAKKINPTLQIVQASLENYENSGQTFDNAVSVMSFCHIKDTNAAFSKIYSLLNKQGELIIIVPDYDYFKLPRHDYKIEVQDLNDDEYIISVTRPNGTIADIVRRNSVYKDAGIKNGFQFIENIPVLPTQDYLAKLPKQAWIKGKPIGQLLRFCKH